MPAPLISQVVRVLSYWCVNGRNGGELTLRAGRKGAGLGFMQLLRPRLGLPNFIAAAESENVVPELLVLCNLGGEQRCV
jgi:hypothetical protein